MLRDRLAHESDAILRGMVTRLRREEGEREATIYGSFAHEDFARLRKVRVALRPEDLDQATVAFRDRLEVTVTGDVEPSGTGVRMRGGEVGGRV